MRDQDAAARAAIFEDDVAALRAALRRGANVNGMVPAKRGEIRTEFALLSSAACYGHEECLKVLIEEGADLSAHGTDALYNAVFTRQVACVRVLLEAGIDVNDRTRDGWTALHSACEDGLDPVVQLLMRYGADVAAEKDGFSPLLLALEAGHRQIVLTLLRAGAPCRVLTSDQVDDENKALNDFVIRNVINAGGWERVVERHRHALLGILSRIALPHDTLLVILSFWSSPGGFK